jgi:integrase
MPRTASGTIETHPWKDGRTITYRARVPFRGRRYRVEFGTNREGWSPERAQNELERIMDRIARGTWTPPERERQPELDHDETVQLTLSRWWAKKQPEIAPNTRLDYLWRIDHVLRELAHEQTRTLNALQVDRFRQALVKAGLAPRSVNMVLDVLAQALDDAVDYGLLESNPARGKRRRMKVPKLARSFLEPDMVIDLLDEAGAWEAELPRHQRYGRRALLALMLLSGGPRISEVCLAGRGEIDLEAGRWRIPASKTDAGARDVELTAFTIAELKAHLAARNPDPHGPLFPTWSGGRHNPSNIRNRLLVETVARVNKKRAKQGRMLLPKVTPHTLRRTFASLALAAGRDVRWVMAQIGHEDARLTLQVYAQVVQRQRVGHELVWKLMRFRDEKSA